MDYFNGNFASGGYKATHKGNADLSSPWTPNFEIMEGMRFGWNLPASYLPLIRYENQFQDFLVMSAGLPVALTSHGALVPAGYKLLLAQGAGHGPQYTSTDIVQGVLNAQGNTPSVGEYVIDSMIAAGISVGYCMGVASYNVYQLSGSDPSNPATYRFHNYNRQSGVAVLTDYLLEYPVEPLKRSVHKIVATAGTDLTEVSLTKNSVVSHTIQVKVNGARTEEFVFVNGTPDKITIAIASGSKYEISFLYEESYYQTPFAGMATWRGAAKHGDLVCVDANSCFVAYTPVVVGDTSAADESANVMAAVDKSLQVIGQVVLVDANFPKQFLDRVKTSYDDRLTGSIVDGRTGTINQLDRMPGSATDGMPHNIAFAGGDKTTGIVRFNMNIR